MTIDRHHERLDAYLDGELSPNDAKAVEAHLEGCPVCRTACLAAREIEGLLGGAVPTLPPGLAARISANATARRAPFAPLWWLALPSSWRLGVAALFVIAAAGGVRLGQRAVSPPDAANTLAATLQSPEIVAMSVTRPAESPLAGRQP